MSERGHKRNVIGTRPTIVILAEKDEDSLFCQRSYLILMPKYPRQVATAVVVGLTTGYILWNDGFSPSVSAASAVVAYFAVRWLIAWAFRVRYWYRRGTRGVYTRSCPDCGQYIYRTSGDWVIKCHQCGWSAGLPVLRWLTKSVPSIQLRRTVWSPQLLVVVLAIGVVVAGGIPASYLAYDDQIDARNTNDNANLSGAITTESSNQDDTSTTGNLEQERTNQEESEQNSKTEKDSNSDSSGYQGGLNIAETERLILRYTNEERESQGLSTVDYAPRMVTIAREHSANMARNDYIGHTKPSGETGEDRYEPVCDYTGSGYLFGENVASAWHKREFYKWRGDSTAYLESEEDVARYLVNQWMRSEGHRENILNPSWEEMVAGIHVADNGKVYATQSFC